MNYIIVPTMSYQMKQKLEKEKQRKEQEKKERHLRVHHDSASTSGSSSKSIISNESEVNPSLASSIHSGEDLKQNDLHSVSSPHSRSDTHSIRSDKSLEYPINPSSKADHGQNSDIRITKFSKLNKLFKNNSKTKSDLSISRSSDTLIHSKTNDIKNKPYPKHGSILSNELSKTPTINLSGISNFDKTPNPQSNLRSSFSSARKLQSSIVLNTASIDSYNIPFSSNKPVLIPKTPVDTEDRYQPFIPITTLSFLNNFDNLKSYLSAPSYQVLRYNLFLDMVSQHHRNDPVNFAHVRQHSIVNFLLRHKSSMRLRDQLSSNHVDIRYYEGLLASELMCCRLFIRKLIARSYQNESGSTNLSHPRLNMLRRESQLIYGSKESDPIIQDKKDLIPQISHEELVQLNIINYVRYVIDLPQEPPKDMNEEFSRHYRYKIFFSRIANCLRSIKKDEVGNNEINSEYLLLQAITKVSYDFILLEKYNIQILTKFNSNSLIEERILKGLFEKFKRKESIPKVLLYNCKFSAQYGWYLATTVPFVHVIDLCIYNEKYEGDQNTKDTIMESDDISSYFNLLDLPSYENYRNLTAKENMDLVRSLETPNSHKPTNLNFYSKNLASIPDNTFDLIHSRDLLFQLTPGNYKYILRQFHRILANGGYVDFPWIILYSQGVSNKFLNYDLKESFDIVPDFSKTVAQEISNIFGKGNVKYSIAVLNPQNEVSRFVINYQGLKLTEVLGKMNEYCDLFDGSGSEDAGSALNKDIHYYLHIWAQKVA